MDKADRRIRRTLTSLHEALMKLMVEKNYDQLTVQEILETADVGRSTFYMHFDGKDDLLLSGLERLRSILETALRKEKGSAKRHEGIIAFSLAMFEHADSHREIYFALSRTQAWGMVRNSIHKILEDLIRRESKSEIARLKTNNSELPAELFIQYLSWTFSSVLTWWIDRKSPLTPVQINEMYRSLVLPTIHSVLH